MKLAAAFYAITGLLVAIGGLQVVTSLVFYEPIYAVAPRAMVLLGPVLVWVGAGVYRLRAKAAKAGLGVAALTLLITGGFGVFALLNTIFSCAGLVAIPLSLASLGLGYAALGPCVRATTAREKLRDEGIELGF